METTAAVDTGTMEVTLRNIKIMHWKLCQQTRGYYIGEKV